MRKSLRIATALVSLLYVHCGDSGGDDTMSTMDNAMEGDTGGASSAGQTGAGTTGGNTSPTTGGGTGSSSGGTSAGSTGGMMPAQITGMEPECITAFTRIAECYLTQPKCVTSAKNNTMILGQGLSAANCQAFANQVGGLPQLANAINGTTPCSSQGITGLFMSLDQSPQIKMICESEPLTAAQCTSSCTNIVPCASGIANMQAAMALGDKANCEANCTMQPALSPVFRCALMAGNQCTAVQACFAGP